MASYYNEIDPYAAQWLRNLIGAGLIAPGDVDERSIVDVRPDELARYTQCHFFAGIGGWSLAARRAGWPDSRALWTGSCPCQPFSTAGKGGGFADERHLWPFWFHVIEQCRPEIVLGEQVANAGGLAWLDLVQADMEGTGYAFAAHDLCAAGVGAPHIRQRLWFVASGGGSLVGPLADSPSARRPVPGEHERGPSLISARSAEHGGVVRPGPTNGRWRDADWLFCRDGKWRPVEPRPQPLVDGLPESLGRVRPEIVQALEAELVAYATSAQIRPDEALRNVCLALEAQTQFGWTAGGLPDLHSPSFLLAFVCQLAAQGWRIAEGLPLSRAEAARPGMRMLWDHEAATRASRQRGLAGQSTEQHPNALYLLSSILARYAQTAWADAYAAYAVIGFPLSRGEPNRVGRLRAYGNAIVTDAAEAHIRAVIEAIG